MTREEEYATAIVDSILSLFRNEEDGGNPNFHYELSEIDATVFFTSMVRGCHFVFNQLTTSEKSALEFTHICNQLIVQDMLEENGVDLDD